MKGLVKLTKFKEVQAVIFLLIPLILVIVNGGTLKSISAYVNYTPVAFTFLLTLAGTLFIYDGFTRGYNFYVGVALFGVVFFNHLEYPVIHYGFAGVFFLGSLFNMVYFSSTKQRPYKLGVAILVLFGMAGTFFFHWYSIFWAEWIGMLPISLHFLFESLGKID